MSGYGPYEYWRKGDKLRSIQEVNPDHPDPKQRVIYALYRLEKPYRGEPFWNYVRQVGCRTETFERWLKGATKHQEKQ